MTRTVPRPAADDISAKANRQEEAQERDAAETPAPDAPVARNRGLRRRKTDPKGAAASSGETAVTLPLSLEDKATIEAAARASRVSPEAFILSHAAKAAEAVLLRVGRHRVTTAQWEKIAQILEEEPTVGDETVEILIRNRR